MQGRSTDGADCPDRGEGRGERGLPSYRPEKRRGRWYAGVMLA